MGLESFKEKKAGNVKHRLFMPFQTNFKNNWRKIKKKYRQEGNDLYLRFTSTLNGCRLNEFP